MNSELEQVERELSNEDVIRDTEEALMRWRPTTNSGVFERTTMLGVVRGAWRVFERDGFIPWNTRAHLLRLQRFVTLQQPGGGQRERR